ncbi:hypothetical protein AX15_005161 [Amanita polypyramis BW_CC]|nr:hypothetical protein AX15_005161 [Amanita polypyramis BW_CC]
MALPIVNLQPSLPTVVQDVYDGVIPHEHVWVSCYASQRPSVHAKIQVVLDERRRDQVVYVTEGDVEVEHVRDRLFSVSCKSLDIPPSTVISPSQEYKDPDTSNPQRPQRITAFDVSPDSSQFTVGHLDGSVYIYPTSSSPTSPPKYTPKTITAPSHLRKRAKPHLRKRAKPHLSAVSSLQYFPSSQVLLTAGIDFTLTILPADPFPSNTESATQEIKRVSPVRTLRSHTRSITSTGIIPPGKNILSSSLDGTVKLWDVPSGEVVSSMISRSPILSMTVAHHLAFCGLQTGHFEVFDTRTQASVLHSSPSAAPHGGLSSIAYNPSLNLLATGSSKGIVAVGQPNLKTTLTTFRRNEASIENLAFRAETGLLAIAPSDGLPYIASLGPQSHPDGDDDRGMEVSVAAELAGVDCDAVRGIQVRDGHVWCASDDGVVRRYECLDLYS